MSAEQLKAYNTASWWDIGVLSMGSYMVWVVLYYIKVCTNLHVAAVVVSLIQWFGLCSTTSRYVPSSTQQLLLSI